MTKAALIIVEQNEENQVGYKKILKKIIGPFQALVPNKTENVELADENFKLYIIKIPKIAVECGKVETRLEGILKWLKEEEISLIAYDEYIQNNPDIEPIIKNLDIDISYGNNIFFSLEIRILKKLLKSKGLDISDTDTVIVSDGNSRYEIGYIKYLSTSVKYLTYVSNNVNIENLIDDIFDNLGFSIRVCSDIRDCLGDTGLVINLTENDALPKGTSIEGGLVVRNINNVDEKSKKGVIVLNEINIDIASKFKLQTEIVNKYKYRICEMYILSKLGKLYLLKQFAEENELAEIYEYFKNEGFKVSGLKGENI